MVDSQIDELIGEYKIHGEDQIMRDYVRLFAAHFERHYLSKGFRPRRAIHAKSHGYLSAVFEVIDHGQPDLQHSVFKEPATYKAVVRISNGDGPPGPDPPRIASVGFEIKVVAGIAKKQRVA